MIFHTLEAVLFFQSYSTDSFRTTNVLTFLIHSRQEKKIHSVTTESKTMLYSENLSGKEKPNEYRFLVSALMKGML